ncbi:Ubiquitin-fold modifier-conjugating enzyme 1 [Meloidogyne graminicola]|uniref:Ubiquitin-fold modifier-conjugating enzyme 1 n=1 Tax=Meloidogyne graminicola TaxID=189291 RepID=A0A8S9ZYK6_9BILA|nr:Ubiquitin-fold modifier-conjugating enzyme 1 [Meloidogyne graminicola]
MSIDELTKKDLKRIPLLKSNAGPRDGPLWLERLKEEYNCLITFINNNKENDSDWFRLESNSDGTRWSEFGKCWTYYDKIKYEFDVEFDIPITYPKTAPEIALPELDGKTAKMYRGGKICLSTSYVITLSPFGQVCFYRNFGVDKFLLLKTTSKVKSNKLFNFYELVDPNEALIVNRQKNAPKFGIAHAFSLGLGPWMAVEIPEMIERGTITKS